MKTRLLWALIFSVGSTAMYFGIVRPDVPTDPKRIRDYLEKDPAAQPPVQLPPLVVSESRFSEAVSLEHSTPVDVAAGTTGANVEAPAGDAKLKFKK